MTAKQGRETAVTSRLDRLLADEFNKFVLTHEAAYFAPLARQIAEMVAVEGRSILDFGCGVGDLGFELLGCGAASLTGVDISQPAVAEACRRVAGRHNVRFLCRDLMSEDWEGPPADLLVSHSVVHYIPLPFPQILERLAGLVRPGGQLYLTIEGHGGPPLLNTLQMFSLRHSPEWLRRSLYYLILPILALKGVGPKNEAEARMLMAKSRYLSIPVIHRLDTAQLAAAAEQAGLAEIRCGAAPRLHPLQVPHIYLLASRPL